MAGRRGPRRGKGVRVIKKTVEKIVEVGKPMKDFPHDEGEMTVGSGVHEIAVKTKNKLVKAQAKPDKKKDKPEDQPTRVWISLEESGALPVCGGDLDKASTEITEDGFVIHLDVKSTERLVKWYVEL